MKHLYVMDPVENINPKTDTTFEFLLEGQNREVENWTCQPTDLIINHGSGFAYAKQTNVIRPKDSKNRHFIFGHRHLIPFDEFKIIWMRKDPPISQEFVSACMILDLHNPRKTRVLNKPSSLLMANEKLWGLRFPNFFAKSVVASRKKTILETVNHFDKAVLKPLFGAGGEGIFVFGKNDPNLACAVDLLTKQGNQPIMIQEYLEAAKIGDKRLILLEGEPIGAMLRVPSGSDHRANLHVGGHAQKANVTDLDREIADHLKPYLSELGLFFTGLDIIGDKITEINVTSPTGLQEIDNLNNHEAENKMASKVFDKLLD